MYLRNRKPNVPVVLLHRISFEGIISTRVYDHGYDEQHNDDIKRVKSCPLKLFQLLLMTSLVLPTVSLATEKNV